MEDPRSIRVSSEFFVPGILSALNLIISGVATLATTNISGAATIGASLVVTGPATAASFSGVGTSLTALNASNLGSGTVPIARLGNAGIPGGTTFFRGDNTWASAVTSVTVANVNGVSASVTNQGTTPQLSFTLGAITPSSVSTTGNVGAATISTTGLASLQSISVASTATIGGTLVVTGAISGPGSGLTGLNASNLGSGTVPIARLGSSGTPSATTFLAGNNSWSTAVTAVSVVAANGVSASIANQGTTPALTFTLGAIIPSSVNTAGSVTASSFVGGTGSFSTITTTGSATLNSSIINGTLSVSGSASIGGALILTGGALIGGVVAADTFIPTGNTVPTYGLFEGESSGGVAIATNSLTRWSVSPTGLITRSAPIVDAAVAISGSTVDCSKGNYFTKTYTGSLTWTFTNVPTGGLYKFVLCLTRGSAGTQTWPSTVRWTSGSTPALTSKNGGNDFLEFWTDDGGASWYAFRTITSTS